MASAASVIKHPGPAAKLAAWTCRAGDSLFLAAECALHNGANVVFVVDDAGRPTAMAGMDEIRAALLAGRHAGGTTIGAIAGPMKPVAHVKLHTDGDGRLTGVERIGAGLFAPVATPDLGQRELRYMLDAVLSSWVSSTGPYVGRFETEFAQRMGAPHAVAVSNGTVALHLPLVALGIGDGDEVIVPDFTFAATINTVIQCGARPVIADVDPVTWCIAPAEIERLATSRTRAVIPVHVFGRPAPMTEIMQVARAKGLYVIEDCAEAHGARYDGRTVGSFGDVGAFSFFANKIMTTGEGGMCMAASGELASRMRILRDHGMKPDRRYWHEEVGFNYRMTNPQAALGCAQLERFDELVANRRRQQDLYATALAGIAGVEMMGGLDDRCEPVIWFASARVPAGKRAELIAEGKRCGIEVRPFFNALSAMPAYARYARPCPVSREISLAGVNLPTGPHVDDSVVAKTADVFRRVLGTA